MRSKAIRFVSDEDHDDALVGYDNGNGPQFPEVTVTLRPPEPGDHVWTVQVLSDSPRQHHHIRVLDWDGVELVRP